MVDRTIDLAPQGLQPLFDRQLLAEFGLAGRPDSNIGQLGYDLEPAFEILAGGGTTFIIRAGTGAARGAVGLADDAAQFAGGGSPNRIYSARELMKRVAEPGPYHNFPESFNAQIFRGNRQVISENYILYTQRGSINGVSGSFEIGVHPSVSGRTETILHRFFRPDRP